MYVTILGSGTCVPSLQRSSCAFLLEVGRQKLLFDIGVGTMHRLTARRVDILDITHIFLSHFHPDHTAELVPFLFSSKYGGGLRTRALTVGAGPGLRRFYAGLQAVYGNWIELEQELLQLCELTPSCDHTEEFSDGSDDFSLKVQTVTHNPESLAYRITGPQGKTVVYSGDTDEDPRLADLAHNADLFICECAFPDERKVSGHLTPAGAGAIARQAGVKLLVLTHFYPPFHPDVITSQCRRAYQGPLILATDLLELCL